MQRSIAEKSIKICTKFLGIKQTVLLKQGETGKMGNEIITEGYCDIVLDDK